MHDLFEVAMGQIGVGIARGNHLALLGQAETAIDTAGRLGADGMVGRATATRDRAAAAVEDGEIDAIGAGDARNSSATSGMSRPLPSSPKLMPTSAMIWLLKGVKDMDRTAARDSKPLLP